MICSGYELGLSDDTETIHVLPEDAPLGVALAEYYRIAGALALDVSVMEEMQRRGGGVADTLRRLEARRSRTLPTLGRDPAVVAG